MNGVIDNTNGEVVAVVSGEAAGWPLHPVLTIGLRTSGGTAPEIRFAKEADGFQPGAVRVEVYRDRQLSGPPDLSIVLDHTFGPILRVRRGNEEREAYLFDLLPPPE